MNERIPKVTETWIFPNEPVKKGPRLIFPETPIKVFLDKTYLSKSWLRARRRRHQRGFKYTSRAR